MSPLSYSMRMCEFSAGKKYSSLCEHWSAPLFTFLLPAVKSCICMRNKIKANRDKSSIAFVCHFMLYAQKARVKEVICFDFNLISV